MGTPKRRARVGTLREIDMTLEASSGAIRQDTILIVDDESDIRNSVAEILYAALQDAIILTAADARGALARLEEGGIDLIIADYRMPGMDGLELLEKAAEMDEEMPRILMTAYPDMNVALEAINSAHVTNFFPKPFKPQEVIDTVWKALDDRWEKVSSHDRDSRPIWASSHKKGDDSGGPQS